MTPAAVAKAESLLRFASHTGAPLSEYALVLTLGEGYELLDYLASGAMGRCLNHAMLELDVAAAKVEGDPWKVLNGFQLMGFDILRADKLS